MRVASAAQHRAPALEKSRSIEGTEGNVKFAHSSQDESGLVIELALASRPVMLIRHHDIGHPVKDSVH
jgi:hypothetical protein